MGVLDIAQKMKSAFIPKKEEDGLDCPSCKNHLDKQEIAANHYVCPKCHNYFRMRAKNRIRLVCDSGSFEEWFSDAAQKDPLDFPGYTEKLAAVREKTNLSEGVTVGKALIDGTEAVLGVCDSRFLMGSMGSVYGERITAAVEQATKDHLPVILFCCSGGARMQEGIVSLMQMAKTSAAIKKHSDAGLLYISVLTDPTTGGVTASFAMLGDIILAEPKALIGFAGPRVIEQTIGEKLPAGFQRAEFQLEHGFVDAIVERSELKQTLSYLIKSYKPPKNREVFTSDFDDSKHVPYRVSEIVNERNMKSLPLTAWAKVKAARSMDRPSTLSMIEYMFDDFHELHGDRQTKDDKAVIGGIASYAGQSFTVIGIQKGNTPKECLEHNFGMAGPEGYRKALRLMKLSEKFGIPIVCLVNTSGAYPGKEAEEKGQGEAIARNLYEMSALTVPVVSVFTGEGGSGGALALGVANEVWMLENATYSILSPEGFASILWKDGNRASEAAEVMKITAQDLKQLRVIDEVIKEYGGACKITNEAISMNIRDKFKEFLEKYDGMKVTEIAAQRYERFRKF